MGPLHRSVLQWGPAIKNNKKNNKIFQDKNIKIVKIKLRYIKYKFENLSWAEHSVSYQREVDKGKLTAIASKLTAIPSSKPSYSDPYQLHVDN